MGTAHIGQCMSNQFPQYFSCLQLSNNSEKNTMLQTLIQMIFVLIFGLALTKGFVTPKHSGTCYLELYQQNNLLGDEVKVQYKRSNIRKINVLSIEVTGDPVYCCFKVFSKKHRKGARITVHGGEEYDDLIELGLIRVKSVQRLKPERCQKQKQKK